MDPDDDLDPLADVIQQALERGWQLISQVAHGSVDNGVWRSARGIIDVVTLPELGPAIVVRLHGGPEHGRPRRVGRQRKRHVVPVQLAVNWLLTDPSNDAALAGYREPGSPESGPP